MLVDDGLRGGLGRGGDLAACMPPTIQALLAARLDRLDAGSAR